MSLDTVDRIEFMTRAEVADFCRVCTRVVDQAVRSGELRAYRVGARRVVLEKSEVLEWLKSQGAAR